MSMEQGPERIPAENKETYKYTYRDNFDGGKIVFECEADGIIQADELYRQAVGADPSKQSHVGCSFEKIER